jgi:hypothetical protein
MCGTPRIEGDGCIECGKYVMEYNKLRPDWDNLYEGDEMLIGSNWRPIPSELIGIDVSHSCEYRRPVDSPWQLHTNNSLEGRA